MWLVRYESTIWHDLAHEVDRRIMANKTIFLIRDRTTGSFMRKLNRRRTVEWVTADKAKNFNRISDAKNSLTFNKLTDTCEIVKCNVTYDVVVK